MKFILPFSGGLDSTYCAWKILSSSDDDLTIVFLDFSKSKQSDLDGRIFANASTKEANAVAKYKTQKIAHWLSTNVRPVNLLFIDFEKGMMPSRSVGSSAIQCIFPMLIEKINSGEYDKIVCSHEKENDGGANGGSTFNSDGTIKRGIGAKKCSDAFEQNAIRGKIDFMLLGIKYTQANAYIEMPDGLRDLTISCDSPVNGVPCGVCFKCSKRKFFCDAIDAGKSSDEIYDAYIKQCTVSDGWWSMKNWLGVYVPTFVGPIKNEIWEMPNWPLSIDKGA